MDEDLLNLLAELSLRSGSTPDDGIISSGHTSRNYNNPSNSNVSSPNHDELVNSNEDDIELKQAVTTLLGELQPTNQMPQSNDITNTNSSSSNSNYDKSKLLLALLGNNDLVTNAVKRISSIVSMGKKMEQIYRSYYRDPSCHIDLNELKQLLSDFSNLYDSENYIREVNVTRVYQAYHVKLMDLYNSRTSYLNCVKNDDDKMIH